jgi:chromate transporter
LPPHLCRASARKAVAIYLGWLRYGVFGGTLTGITFILPSFLMVVALAAFYVHFGSLSWIQGAFYGIGATFTR